MFLYVQTCVCGLMALIRRACSSACATERAYLHLSHPLLVQTPVLGYSRWFKQPKVPPSKTMIPNRALMWSRVPLTKPVMLPVGFAMVDLLIW